MLTAKYDGLSHVTRKVTSPSGHVRFGGWAGQARARPHVVSLAAAGYAPLETHVQIRPGATSGVTVRLQPQAGAASLPD